ncbi:MAG: type II toxin-antitoxin system RelE family toxin [Wolbachia sp.]
MGYTIIFVGKVIKKDLPNLPKTIRLRIVKAINKLLTVDRINLGEPLYYSLKGRRRLRVGTYRIIYRVNTAEYKVITVAIGHRDTIYEEALKIINKYFQ